MGIKPRLFGMPEQEKPASHPGEGSPVPAELPVRSVLRYEREMLRLALDETWGELRSRTKEAAVTFVAALVGAIRGANQGGLVEAGQNALLAAVVASVLVYLYNLATMSARIRATEQLTIKDLEARRDQLRSEVTQLEADNHLLVTELEGRAIEIRGRAEEESWLSAEVERLTSEVDRLTLQLHVAIVPPTSDPDQYFHLLRAFSSADETAVPVEDQTKAIASICIHAINRESTPTKILGMRLALFDEGLLVEVEPLQHKEILKGERRIAGHDEQRYELEATALYDRVITDEDGARRLRVLVEATTLPAGRYVEIPTEFFRGFPASLKALADGRRVTMPKNWLPRAPEGD